MPPEHWTQLDEVNLADEVMAEVPTMQDVPRCIRGSFRTAYTIALQHMRKVYTDPPGDDAQQQQERAWKLFVLLSRMLLRKTTNQGAAGKQELGARFELFYTGHWLQLLEGARQAGMQSERQARPRASPRTAQNAKRQACCAKVKQGEVSAGRHTLTAADLAPGTPGTLAELRDEEKRPRTPGRPVDPDIPHCQPPMPVELDMNLFFANVRSSRRGAAGGMSGQKNAHLKPLLENEQSMEALGFAARMLAQGSVPASVAAALALGRLTALLKPNGRVRGIATGDTFRRLVARTLAQQFASRLNESCEPFQFALSTRAGTDAVVHLIRAMVDADADATVVSIDGIGAYDHVHRAAIFRALADNPSLRALLPFVRLWYGRTSHYAWRDQDGTQHVIEQGEGVEQGDALSPALFALGLHAALCDARSRLHNDDVLVAFLDDIYLVTKGGRAREAFDTVANAVYRGAGVRANLGKCRVWSRAGGKAPEGIAELGPDVWRGDRTADARGLVLLGTPLGSPEYVRAHTDERLATERRLLAELPVLPDPQCAWCILAMCAAPMANHMLRTLPPDEVMPYARAHDAALWDALWRMLNHPGGTRTLKHAQRLGSLPARLGGIGLRSAERTAPAAYWASWADALPTLRAKCPRVAETIIASLNSTAAQGSVAAAQGALAAVQRAGYTSAPTWEHLAAGTAAPPALAEESEPEPGEWRHGWQHKAAQHVEAHYRETTVLPALRARGRAMLRSGAGPFAGAWLHAVPTTMETTMVPACWQVAMRRRLQVRLPMVAKHCEGRRCRARLDSWGDHRASCMRAGRVQRRGAVLERAWMRVFVEAGFAVVPKPLLRDCNVPLRDARDSRQLDFRTSSIDGSGLLTCADVTVVSAVTGAGQPHGRAADVDGVALAAAADRKADKYPELAEANPYGALTVLAMEIGGRWGDQAVRTLRAVVRCRVQQDPWLLRRAAAQAWTRRWSCLLSVALQAATAASLLDGQGPPAVAAGEPDVLLADVLTDAVGAPPPDVSRMPLLG